MNAGKRYDAIIIGGGHNGLVAAAYLAKAKARVLLLERSNRLGGVAVTEEFTPGFWADSVVHEVSMFRPAIVKDLFLKMHGLELLPADPVVFAPLPDGNALTLWSDVARTATEIGRFSAADAACYPEYQTKMATYATFLSAALAQLPPDPKALKATDLWPWLRVSRAFKGLGEREMYALLRLLPMSLFELMSEWFEHPAVQGVLAAPGLTGIRQGVYSGGTAFVLLYHLLGHGAGGLPATGWVRGGVGQLAQALAAAATAMGAEIRTEAEVARVSVSDGVATGVVLSSGEEISARAVLSGASPRHTFFDLVGTAHLDTAFVRAVQNIRFRGAVAKVNLALDGLPTFTALPEGDSRYLQGRIQISPSLNYLEKAYDAAKYGRISSAPYLEARIPTLLDPSLAPPGKHVISIWMQYAPYDLRDGNWEDAADTLGETVLKSLAAYAPDLPDMILQQQVLTPLELEKRYGLSEGAIYHGEMMLDQLLFMRPVAGWSQYHTPISQLYLCGAGSHPGGGVTGEPGRLAAAQLLQLWKKKG